MWFRHTRCSICVVALAQLFSFKNVQLNNTEEGYLSALPSGALWVRLHLKEERENSALAELD